MLEKQEVEWSRMSHDKNFSMPSIEALAFAYRA